MSNLMKKNETYYKYNILVNQWAVIEFLKGENLLIKELNYGHLCLLSVIVYLYHVDKLNHIDVEGYRYTYMSDNLLRRNLPFISGKSRQFKNYIQKLEQYSFIQRYVKNRQKRYIRVSSKLLKLLNMGELRLSATEYLKKYHKKDFRLIYLSYSFNCSDYHKKELEKSLSAFDEYIYYEQFTKKDYSMNKDELLSRLEMYLKGVIKKLNR